MADTNTPQLNARIKVSGDDDVRAAFARIRDQSRQTATEVSSDVQRASAANMSGIASAQRALGTVKGDVSATTGLVKGSLSDVQGAANTAASSIKSVFDQVGLGKLVAGAGLAGIATAFATFVQGNQVALSTLDDLRDKLRLNVEYIQTWQAAVRIAGGTTDNANSSLEHVGDLYEQAKEKGDTAAVAFAQIGVQTRNAAGDMKPFSQVLDESIRAIAAIPDKALQVRAAMAVFGSSYRSALDVIKNDSSDPKKPETYDSRLRDAQDTGVVNSQARLDALAEHAADTQTLEEKIRHLYDQFTYAFTPLFDVNPVKEWLTSNLAFIDQFLLDLGRTVVDTKERIKSVFTDTDDAKKGAKSGAAGAAAASDNEDDSDEEDSSDDKTPKPKQASVHTPLPVNLADNRSAAAKARDQAQSNSFFDKLPIYDPDAQPDANDDYEKATGEDAEDRTDYDQYYGPRRTHVGRPKRAPVYQDQNEPDLSPEEYRKREAQNTPSETPRAPVFQDLNEGPLSAEEYHRRELQNEVLIAKKSATETAAEAMQSISDTFVGGVTPVVRLVGKAYHDLSDYMSGKADGGGRVPWLDDIAATVKDTVEVIVTGIGLLGSTLASVENALSGSGNGIAVVFHTIRDAADNLRAGFAGIVSDGVSDVFNAFGLAARSVIVSLRVLIDALSGSGAALRAMAAGPLAGMQGAMVALIGLFGQVRGAVVDTFGAIGQAFSGASITAQQLGVVIGSVLGTYIALGSIGYAVLSGIGALVFGLIANSQTLRDVMSSLTRTIFDTFGQIVGMVTDALAGVRAAFAGIDLRGYIVPVLNDFHDRFVATFGVIVELVRTSVAIVGGVIAGLRNAVAQLHPTFNQLAGTVLLAAAALTLVFAPAFLAVNLATGLAVEGISYLTNAFGGMDSIVRVVGPRISAVFDAVVSNVRAATTALRNAFLGLRIDPTVEFNWLTQMAAVIGGTFRAIVQQATAFVQSIAAVLAGQNLSPLASFAWVGQVVDIFRRAFTAIRDAVSRAGLSPEQAFGWLRTGLQFAAVLSGNWYLAFAGTLSSAQQALSSSLSGSGVDSYLNHIVGVFADRYAGVRKIMESATLVPEGGFAWLRLLVGTIQVSLTYIVDRFSDFIAQVDRIVSGYAPDPTRSFGWLTGVVGFFQSTYGRIRTIVESANLTPDQVFGWVQNALTFVTLLFGGFWTRLFGFLSLGYEFIERVVPREQLDAAYNWLADRVAAGIQAVTTILSGNSLPADSGWKWLESGIALAGRLFKRAEELTGEFFDAINDIIRSGSISPASAFAWVQPLVGLFQRTWAAIRTVVSGGELPVGSGFAWLPATIDLLRHGFDWIVDQFTHLMQAVNEIIDFGQVTPGHAFQWLNLLVAVFGDAFKAIGAWIAGTTVPQDNAFRWLSDLAAWVGEQMHALYAAFTSDDPSPDSHFPLIRDAVAWLRGKFDAITGIFKDADGNWSLDSVHKGFKTVHDAVIEYTGKMRAAFDAFVDGLKAKALEVVAAADQIANAFGFVDNRFTGGALLLLLGYLIVKVGDFKLSILDVIIGISTMVLAAATILNGFGNLWKVLIGVMIAAVVTPILALLAFFVGVPVGIAVAIGLAVSALAAFIYAAVKDPESWIHHIGDAFTAAWDSIKSGASSTFDWLADKFEGFAGLMAKVWRKIRGQDEPPITIEDPTNVILPGVDQTQTQKTQGFDWKTFDTPPAAPAAAPGPDGTPALREGAADPAPAAAPKTMAESLAAMIESMKKMRGPDTPPGADGALMPDWLRSARERLLQQTSLPATAASQGVPNYTDPVTTFDADGNPVTPPADDQAKPAADPNARTPVILDFGKLGQVDGLTGNDSTLDKLNGILDSLRVGTRAMPMRGAEG